MMVQETIDHKEEDSEEPFEFNENGLTSVEAERRLLQYGKNELPEDIDPIWLTFVKILSQPMVCVAVLQQLNSLERLHFEL